MEGAMEEEGEEVVYETRRHSSRPYKSNYPPQLLLSESNHGKLGFFSRLSARGLKQKWSSYQQTTKIKRRALLFVSARGELVAVAAGNEITILHQEDDYKEPCGIFTSGSLGTVIHGAWAESHDVLGIFDENETLWFIKANGEELSRITSRQLKISSPIIGLIAHDFNDLMRSCLCSFIILTSDGSLHQTEISHEVVASTSSMQMPRSSSPLKQPFPQSIFCFEFHPELSLLIFVGRAAGISVALNQNSGSSYVSIWRRYKNLDIEPLSFIQFEGLYCEPNGRANWVAYPKVLVSPGGKIVATLDMGGFLHLFKLNKESWSLSSIDFGPKSDSQVANMSMNVSSEFSRDIVDFTWWSENILALAKRGGTITMVDLLCSVKIQEDCPIYSLPILERVYQLQGHIFLLESTSRKGGCNEVSDSKSNDLPHFKQSNETFDDQIDISRLRWSLMSFTQKSALEMYNILIGSQQYQAALDFADRHMLDKDEVLKSQWLNSGRGVREIKMFLSNIKDEDFVISECIDRVGATEDAAKSLLAHGLHLTNQYGFSKSEGHDTPRIWDFRMARLQLLQYTDILETFLGINMGRYSDQEYRKLRSMPISQAAIALAQSGKIGALNLLFKRHPYSLTPSMLQILAAIPETVPIQTYAQFLPGRSTPTITAIREEDWVECDKLVSFMNNLSSSLEVRVHYQTEPIIKRSMTNSWPSAMDLSIWYRSRAIDIDSCSGQLGNSQYLVEFACRKGIFELQKFHEDICYLHHLIYSDESDDNICFNMDLRTWEQLCDYEKFRIMLKGVTTENVVRRLHDTVIPFMQNRGHDMKLACQDRVRDDEHSLDLKDDSYLVRWMKEVAGENKLDICLTIFEEGCKEFPRNIFFRDDLEAIDCAIQCLYLCTATDRWSTMANIVSKLPLKQDAEINSADLQKRSKQVESHIEAGRILANYQVPKPMNFFLEAHADEKGVKQVLRLILSKFSRRQPRRSDNDWASMWRDMQCLREKVFLFLELEFIFMEFFRGLLKAGKFSLARNYLKGTSSVALPPEKAENLVIQAAREYFFSASSLVGSEIWKARECLNILPSSRNVKAEADIIDALTVKLPNLGVTILPMQFRQIKDKMQIIQMAITSQAGSYLHIDELIEIAKLLGLNSSNDISAVQEAVAREAAVAGDLQLAFDLCLILTKKGHGFIWDLCVAIARGPALENMDLNSRKHLLGFALSHCDEESIGELLHGWKDLDMQRQCETLKVLTHTNSPNFSVHGSSVISNSACCVQDIVDLRDCSDLVEEINIDDQEVHVRKIKNILSGVVKEPPVVGNTDLESLLRENEKLLSFAALQLPWLLELSRKEELGKRKLTSGFMSSNHYVSIKAQSMLTILFWLVKNSFSPADNLIASLAKSIFEVPVNEDEDLIGCSFLLNLVDAFNGVEVIEVELKKRESYQDICSIMNAGMTYSWLRDAELGCTDPDKRRELLLKKFGEKHASLSSDEINKINQVQSSFWKEWKLKLERKKHVVDHSRMIERIIPDVQTARFLSCDSSYIKTTFSSLIESIKFEKKHVLKDVLKLANMYGLNHTEVLLQCLSSILVSDVWRDDDIKDEILEFRGEIVGCATKTIDAISLDVYPAIGGCNKLRLAFLYGLLSECYSHVEETKEHLPLMQSPLHISTLKLSQFYKISEQECIRVSFIKNLNFKNIARLDGLNLQNFNREVERHINKFCLEPLAEMVRDLVSIYPDPLAEGLMLWTDVYKHYMFSLLITLASRSQKEVNADDPENFLAVISQAEEAYNSCKNYVKLLAPSDALEIMKCYLKLVIPLHGVYGSIPDNSTWQECLLMLLNFWIRVAEDMQEVKSSNSPENFCFNPESSLTCLKILMKLIMEDSVAPSQGWGSLNGYANQGLIGDFATEVLTFCRSMLLSGCGFGAISEVFSESVAHCTTTDFQIQDLRYLYILMLDPIIQYVVHGSNEHENLYCLLSSLSKLEGEMEVLKSVRHVVWDKLAALSTDLELPSHIRVYVLELMQFISGKFGKGFSPEITQNVAPWEGWEELFYTTEKSKAISDEGLPDHPDTCTRFTTTLVALKSSRLVAAISPSIEVTPNDLLHVDTAVPCFFKLCSASSADHHFDILVEVLEEWDSIFGTSRVEIASGAGQKWSIDDWDEGWESPQEVEPLEGEDKAFSVHPLHTCWAEIFRKFIKVSRFRDALKLIDQSLLRSKEVLLDEDDAMNLSEIILRKDCFVALKIALLLPYEKIQLQCLDVVEDKLKQGVPDSSSSDLEFFMLVLASGVISTMVSNSSFSNSFYYVSFLAGNLSRNYQEVHTSERGRNRCKNDNGLFVFARFVFPCFISELVKANQQVLAGFLVSKTMHSNAPLSILNVAEASLKSYLFRQLHVLQHDEAALEEKSSCHELKGIFSKLRDGLPNKISLALSVLSANTS